MRIGIPEALSYDYLSPVFDSFLQKVKNDKRFLLVMSGETNDEIFEAGVRQCVDDACLPLKLFFGHVMHLADKVDSIFIPGFLSIRKREYICPKIAALPDMLRYSIRNLPPLIDPDVNFWKRGATKTGCRKISNIAEKMLMSLYSDGRFTEHADYIDYIDHVDHVDDAADTGDSDRCIIKRITERNTAGTVKCNSKRISDNWDSGARKSIISVIAECLTEHKANEKNPILLLGHPYMLYDRMANQNLLEKLNKLGLVFITPEMIKGSGSNQRTFGRTAFLPAKPLFWTHGQLITNCVCFAIERLHVTGILYVSSFGCGVDSFTCDIVRRYAVKKASVPFMQLTFDEHSGEAGLDTRLEAFADIVSKYDKKEERYFETDIPTYR